MSSIGLQHAAKEARIWLLDTALPLWYAKGLDAGNWGFSERLNQRGEPLAEPRRINVQARQIYVFAEAKNLGWTGDWESPINHGLKALSKYRRDDGLYRFKLNPDGSVFDDHPEVYGQAFVLLALAYAGSALGDIGRFEADAVELLGTLKQLRGHDKIGFDENKPSSLPLRSNPHMHLFECCQAWMARSSAQIWSELSSDIAELALEHFREPDSGFLCEHFDAAWNPLPDSQGLLCEPGHQFEWAWLLHCYGMTTKQPNLLVAARSLHSLGLSGIDPARGIPFMSWTVGQGPRPGNTRLWPITEWLKSALVQGDEDEAIRAWKALQPFLKTPIAGLWYDQMTADGNIVDEPAPASTLYHITCAISELIKAAQA
jgi:mannose/cellobiose epimerase-like protein (N-acyl-D-glucosamine 2-epimerase family)